MKYETKLIIPAAGIGSRIGLSYPKALFPINGQPILAHILQACSGLVMEGVVVTSPSGNPQITDFLASWHQYPTYTTIQDKPVGMADAVWKGVNFFSSTKKCDYLVIWGDQVTVQKSTLQKILEYHSEHENWMTFPTSIRSNPYIHIQRDLDKKVIGVLEQREGDEMPAVGESDCGVFVIRGEVLLEGLDNLRAITYNTESGKYTRLNKKSSGTGEFNFLPLITLWAHAGYPVEALPIADEGETFGINSRADADFVEKISTPRNQ